MIFGHRTSHDFEPGSLGTLVAPDEREPDCHAFAREFLAAPMPTYRERLYISDELVWDDRWARSRDLRDQIISRYSFAVPTAEAIDAIVNYSPNGIIEIGAGLGYSAYLLRSRGIDVVALDVAPVESGENVYWPEDGMRSLRTGIKPRPWTEVVQGRPDATADYNARSLFLCWPPHSDSMALDALRAYRGDTLIYIGEHHGGCTADAFFDVLERGWMRVPLYGDVVQLCGVHDHLFVYRRYAR